MVDHTTQSLQALSRQDKDMTLLKTRVLISFVMLSLALVMPFHLCYLCKLYGASYRQAVPKPSCEDVRFG